MSLVIRPFAPEYAKAFQDLNLEWLRTYFYVEPYDKEVLGKPETYIIDKGGSIFFAVDKDVILGTVALMPTTESSVLELTKMAVLPEVRGKGIGQILLKHCIDFSRSHNYRALVLYSNTRLENAIYLYRKYGFTELELEADNPYDRADIKMRLDL
jgi:ribosomal protein S18 acetylase RimI-like enzyme